MGIIFMCILLSRYADNIASKFKIENPPASANECCNLNLSINKVLVAIKNQISAAAAADFWYSSNNYS